MVKESELIGQVELERITRSPSYLALVSQRSRLSWILTVTMLLIFFGYILLIAFSPDTLARPLAEGTVTTLGIPIGIGVILAGITLTGIYVALANRRFDALEQSVREEASND